MSLVEAGDELTVDIESNVTLEISPRMEGLKEQDIGDYLNAAVQKAINLAGKELQSGKVPLTDLGFS